MAMNFNVMNNVYNHYLTTYAPKGTTPFDTHKKSELRNVYNSIVKLNKESPVYLIKHDKNIQEFAIDLKENARELRNTIASLGGLDETELLNHKVASSSNENIASAKFVGSQNTSMAIPKLEIEVRALATPQSNLGHFLPSEEMELAPDAYSFDIGIHDLYYEFQYNINAGDNNRDVQNRLCRLVNNAGIGLEAEVMEDDQGNSALLLRSTALGLEEDQTSLFHVSDTKTSKTAGTVSYFGLDDITRPASNAEFLINGIEKTASSNNFMIEKTFEITLNGISSPEGESTTIGLKTDIESLSENMNSLIGGYNHFLKAAEKYPREHTKSQYLLQELKNISAYHKEDLNAAGLNVQEDGTITVDDNTLSQLVESGDVDLTSSAMKEFTNSILRKTNQISINPMNYVDKTIVAYKNPGKNFSTPYITSAYSGMMFNSYC